MNSQNWSTYFEENPLPVNFSPLVHCVTNEITNELLANGLLFIGAKPIMAEDIREFPALFEKTDSLFLNLGKLSPAKEAALLAASQRAKQKQKPVVLDIVGAAATPLRLALAQRLAKDQPTVVKGNISEMRAFCGLETNSRGVDGDRLDQESNQLLELVADLQEQDPASVYLATGVKDVIVHNKRAYLMENGVPELDRFTGTGDLVGALITAFLGAGMAPLAATLRGVSYLNSCGEVAKQKELMLGMADFRQETMNQLSLLDQQADWWKRVKGRCL
ncbi:hydroxyethylthiazole kinase [Enterococcus olivae]